MHVCASDGEGRGPNTPAPAANPSVPILVHPSAREKNHKKKVANWPLPLDRLRQVLRAVPRGADMDLRLMEEVGCISGHEAQAKPPVPPRTFRVRRAGFPRLGLGDIGGVPTPTPTPSFAAGRCGPPPATLISNPGLRCGPVGDPKEADQRVDEFFQWLLGQPGMDSVGFAPKCRNNPSISVISHFFCF